MHEFNGAIIGRMVKFMKPAVHSCSAEAALDPVATLSLEFSADAFSNLKHKIQDTSVRKHLADSLQPHMTPLDVHLILGVIPTE